MVRRFNFGEIKLKADGDRTTERPKEDTPFCIAILGDFGGQSHRMQPAESIADRGVVPVDRDNFDQVMANLGVEITLALDARNSLNMRFSELDDFLPDRLFERAAIFSKLHDLRARVANPDTFPAVAKELGLQAVPTPARREESLAREPSVSAVASNLAMGSLLDATVEQTEHGRQSGTSPTRAASELDRFVQRVVEPHLVAAADPRQAEMLAMVDRALTAQMRALLHVPALQSLEGAWRALYFLVRRIQTGTQLKLFLVDVSKDELAVDFHSSPDLTSAGVYRLLVERSARTPGADPWAVIVGNYEFGPSWEDAELLGKLGKVAQFAGAPFVAAASPRLLGCDSLADTPHPREWTLPPDPNGTAAWKALRATSHARWIGLAFPRFLLRLPYGKKADPIESFDFEEMPQPPVHEDYLWGNPAFTSALLLAQSFSDDGWNVRPGTHNQIDGLPLHVYERDGESELKPCAEALLTEDAAVQILEHGLMPLVSVKGSDEVRVVRFESIAEPLHALAGTWTQ